MNRTLRTSTIALALAAGWAMPVHAAAAKDNAVMQQLAAMQAQLEQLNQRVGTLEGDLAAAKARAEAAEAQVAVAVAKAEAAKVAVAAIPAASVTARPATDVTWDGAPKLATKDGWSFKPRGRMQLDVAGVDAPDSIISRQKLGIATEIRRAYMGFDGTMPGGFGYRIEAEFANAAVELTDIYLTYKVNPRLTVTVGQHKPFQSMEDMTSDLFSSFMERAAFNSAFGFERRVGVSATYTGKQVLVQGGVFTDNARDLLTDSDNSFSLDGRVVFMPKLAGGQLHIGGSGHYREFNDLANIANYAARPFVHTTDLRLVSTGNIGASGERAFGGELAYIHGRFHATAESSWITAIRPGLTNPTFNGGYAEVGYLLTDDVTAYKNGAYDRIRPKTPLGKGGIGAVQANLRYDWLDLNSGTIRGGRQQIAGASVVWMPTDYTRFILNYGHIWLNDAAVAAGLVRDYTADSIGMRAQIDF
ncbi:OprO/OprP family phosphate-selective porin [Novosphingobium sp.]|uniref:OprO/OprP family phosphate-selective porin n=1 Tax=Novosphingobium sp. TaxID=1874826 RepID=UPI0027336CE4|nr:porin [Novosphingobium sp.]MDP3907232.1 porin [Novosphingobium sp.]